MRAKNFISIFIFSLFLCLTFVSAVSTTEFFPNIYVNSTNSVANLDDSGICADIDDYIGDWEYVASWFYFTAPDGTGTYSPETTCNSEPGDTDTRCIYWYENYYYIVVGYQNVGTPAQHNTWVNGSPAIGYHNALCATHHSNSTTADYDADPFTISDFNMDFYNPWGDFIPVSVRISGSNTSVEQIYQNIQNASTSVSMLQEMGDKTLSPSAGLGFYLNDYYSSYTYVSLRWYDVLTNGSGTISTSKLDTTEKCAGDLSDGPSNLGIMTCLSGTGDDVILYFYGTYSSQLVNYTLDVRNANTGLYDYFSVNTSTVTSTDYDIMDDDFNDTSETGYLGYVGRSFIGYYATMLSNLFPESSSITPRIKFAFVLISFLALNILLAIFVYSKLESKTLIIFLSVFLNVATFFFLVSVSYIPASVIIVLLIVALLLGFLKLRS